MHGTGLNHRTHWAIFIICKASEPAKNSKDPRPDVNKTKKNLTPKKFTFLVLQSTAASEELLIKRVKKYTRTQR